MALTLKLSPPHINSKLPAFCGNTLIIPFTLNRAVGFNQFENVVAIVKTVSTGTQKAFLSTGVKNGVDCGKVWYDNKTRSYRAQFNIQNTNKDGSNYFDWTIGQYYKIQLACQSNIDSENGYYSSVGVIKCSAEPMIYIQGLDKDKNNKNIYEYTGVYVQEHDMSEKVYSYRFDLYDESSDIVATTDWKIHNNSIDIDLDSSSNSWRVTKNLISNKSYYIQYKVITLNGLGEMVACESPKYKITELDVSLPNIGSAKFSAKVNDVEGYIQLSLEGKEDLLDHSLRSGAFILIRSSSKNNYDTWEQLTEFELSLYDPWTTKEIYRDYIVEQGVHYIYAIQSYNQQGYMSGRLKNHEGAVRCDFEDAFLYDGKRQLKIRFNPSISGLKPVILENKIETIGSKYPFIFRNGIVNYTEFSISGLLSLLGDENKQFLFREEDNDWDLYQPNGNSYYQERQFKLAALNWLSDGKVKLFKSPAEGNYLVRLMNVNLAPEETLGRLLHTFNCDACEIAEYTFENMEKYNLIPGYSNVDDLRLYSINLNNVPPQFVPQGGYGNKDLALPQTYQAKIVGTPGITFTYQLLNDVYTHSGKIGSNGVYQFNSEELEKNPLIRVTLGSGLLSWGSDAFLYIGYKDPRVKTFSYIYDVGELENKVELPIKDKEPTYEDFTGQQVVLPPFYDGKVDEVPEDEVLDEPPIQDEELEDMPEEEEPKTDKKYWMIDFIKFWQDLHKKLGMFYHVQISKRPIYYLWYQNGSLKGYYDKDGSKIEFKNNNYSIFDPNAIYKTDDEKYFYDGLDLVNKQSFTNNKKPLEQLTNYFAMDGKLYNMDKYNKDSKTFTDISSLSNFKIGSGLRVDMVYQEKVIKYVVEEPNSEFYDENVVNAKNKWQQSVDNHLDQSIIDTNYKDYLDKLQKSINNLNEYIKVVGEDVVYAM